MGQLVPQSKRNICYVTNKHNEEAWPVRLQLPEAPPLRPVSRWMSYKCFTPLELL